MQLSSNKSVEIENSVFSFNQFGIISNVVYVHASIKRIKHAKIDKFRDGWCKYLEKKTKCAILYKPQVTKFVIYSNDTMKDIY